ncbi:MAG: hypothetical protein WDZ88_00915 [Candidatus Paceibacterota bacterium]
MNKWIKERVGRLKARLRLRRLKKRKEGVSWTKWVKKKTFHFIKKTKGWSLFLLRKVKGWPLLLLIILLVIFVIGRLMPSSETILSWLQASKATFGWVAIGAIVIMCIALFLNHLKGKKDLKTPESSQKKAKTSRDEGGGFLKVLTLLFVAGIICLTFFLVYKGTLWIAGEAERRMQRQITAQQNAPIRLDIGEHKIHLKKNTWSRGYVQNGRYLWYKEVPGDFDLMNENGVIFENPHTAKGLSESNVSRYRYRGEGESGTLVVVVSNLGRK